MRLKKRNIELNQFQQIINQVNAEKSTLTKSQSFRLLNKLNG